MMSIKETDTGSGIKRIDIIGDGFTAILYRYHDEKYIENGYLYLKPQRDNLLPDIITCNQKT